MTEHQNTETVDDTDDNNPVSIERVVDVGNADPTDSENSNEENIEADTENGDDNAQLKRARKDAAGYRERLRKAERDRDTAHGTIDALRRQIAEGYATADGLKPDALWSAGYSPDDFTDDNGAIEPEKVQEAISDARERFGIARFNGTADQGKRPATETKTAPSWGDLVNP